jgi:inorganic pyrophosphatase/exopolyphosphatase
MKVITSGKKFLDIDAYGGIIAYAELLRLQGESAIAFSSATINESVTQTILSWPVDFSKTYVPLEADTFTLIDVSDPEHFDRVVAIDRVERVIDHHIGVEAFWQERIGEDATIEFIGAACTQVYEAWVVAEKFDLMSETSARLLVAGILDNTLNFKASVTTDRDRNAYEALLIPANLPPTWSATYFTECEQAIFADIANALDNDTKTMTFKHLTADAIAVGQLVVWNGQMAVKEYRKTVEDTMSSLANNWFVNIVSIDEGHSYFLAANENIEQWAEKVMQVQFENGRADATRLWLRKEIYKEDQSLL